MLQALVAELACTIPLFAPFTPITLPPPHHTAFTPHSHPIHTLNTPYLHPIHTPSTPHSISQVLQAVVAELAAFLRKSNKPLRQASLVALDVIVNHHAAALAASDFDALLEETPPLLSDADLHVAHLALVLKFTSILGAEVYSVEEGPSGIDRAQKLGVPNSSVPHATYPSLQPKPSKHTPPTPLSYLQVLARSVALKAAAPTVHKLGVALVPRAMALLESPLLQARTSLGTILARLLTRWHYSLDTTLRHSHVPRAPWPSSSRRCCRHEQERTVQ